MVTLELSRGDGSVNTFLGVQNGLAMGSINMLGSRGAEAALAAGDGHAGQDRRVRADRTRTTAPTPSALETTARRDGDHWVLNGAKRWIGNGSIADVVIVWARDVADGKVKGFVVEKRHDRRQPTPTATPPS